MRRLGRWSLVGVALAGVIMAFSVAPGGATPPSGQTSLVLARGTDISNGTIPLQAGTDIAMSQITIEPGGSTGWHSHPGGAIVIIKQGSVTAYDSIGSQCQIETHSAGEAFIERPGVVHQVVNTGTVQVINMVVFPRVPLGAATRIDEPDPGTCPGL